MRRPERGLDERGRMIACREQVVGVILESRAGIDRNVTHNIMRARMQGLAESCVVDSYAGVGE